MFSNLKDFLSGSGALELDVDGEATSRELKIATITVLLKMAHADNAIHDEELSVLYQAVRDHFAQTYDEASELMVIAEHLRKDEKRTSELISMINEHFTDEQRQKILGIVWRVAKADGIVDRYEIEYATRIRALLKLTLEQAMSARQSAESED